MALKLKYEYESNSWHRYPHLVSWRDADSKNKDSDPTNDLVGEMAAWLRRSSIDHAQLMLNEYWTEQWRTPHKIISGFRFLTEAEATMFWLQYQGNDD
jgi:hypothetical protein